MSHSRTGGRGSQHSWGEASCISRCLTELSCLQSSHSLPSAPAALHVRLQPSPHLQGSFLLWFFWFFEGKYKTLSLASSRHCRRPRQWRHRRQGCNMTGLGQFIPPAPLPASLQPSAPSTGQAVPVAACPDSHAPLPGGLELLPDTQNTPCTVSPNNTDLAKPKYMY